MCSGYIYRIEGMGCCLVVRPFVGTRGNKMIGCNGYDGEPRGDSRVAIGVRGGGV